MFIVEHKSHSLPVGSSIYLVLVATGTRLVLVATGTRVVLVATGTRLVDREYYL
jgi:hypothetical protein